MGVEFGEKLLWKVKNKSGKMEKLRPRWDHGIFVGVRPRSGELLVATRTGIRKTRSVLRIPEEERWTKDTLEWVKYVPWHRTEDDPEADGDLPEGVEPANAEVREEGGNQEKIIIVSTKEAKPHAMYNAEKM